ncbi:hypothetical protein [Streptomyces violascens]|nr:hypothetical protein [Streptomyces violascens]
MNDRRPEGPGDAGAAMPEPVPRDLPDQQAGLADDPWEAAGDAAESTRDARPDREIPDTDEAGTGRRGAPHSGSTRAGHPVPDESTA